ncbi:PilT protein domain protein [Crenothrix polyspora]|jgi:PIN domain nuclease of toxin-antitoxin system|uniref:PilT protein domain protein n=1 Tax=Crenothrix polyspora TaxID=360316 RepID=A0A1R4H2D3_9GAMM|nr:type II toxin-antitoxin system VapC family toxin [Crenothrix polyspora]SJM90336.1 PilT protein domain protein [Crenothrix polyspora]
MIVLDASALLAYLFRESGHDIVEKYIENACISTVNLSEVAGRFSRDGIDVTPIIQHIEKTSIEIIPFTQIHALYAADFIPKTKHYGLSLGDRACLGLATAKNLAVLTADAAWSEIEDISIKIIQIR